jgi:hypothetical protein
MLQQEKGREGKDVAHKRAEGGMEREEKGIKKPSAEARLNTRKELTFDKEHDPPGRQNSLLNVVNPKRNEGGNDAAEAPKQTNGADSKGHLVGTVPARSRGLYSSIRRRRRRRKTHQYVKWA